MSRTIRQQKGFTLVELLVTIAILAILAGVCVAGYTSFIQRAYISNDESLIAQLNSFKNAYLVNREEITEENINPITYEITTQAGLHPLVLQSAEFGYGIYYDMLAEKYALILNDEIDNTYIEIDLNYIPDYENEDTEDVTPDEPPTPDIPIVPDSPITPNPDDDGENNNAEETTAVPPIFTLTDFVAHKGNITEENYCYSSNGIIYIGLKVNMEDGSLKEHETLKLEDIKIVDIANNIESQIIEASINGTIISNTYKFEAVGEYSLNLVVSNGTTQETIIIPIICRNIYLDDAIVNLESNIVKSYETKLNANGTYTFKLSLENVLSGTHIIDYIYAESKIENTTLSGNSELKQKVSILVMINSENHYMEKIQGTYDLKFDNIIDDDGIIDCSIVVIYQGTNGKCIEDTIVIPQ